MNPDSILEGLDPEQREVASNLSGPMLVLAGAGTGKTRAITHRIAYGVASGQYIATQVLAVTFTARAAAEMRARLRALGALNVQARTFHAAALRQLRFFWPQAIGGSLPTIVEGKARLIMEAASRLRITTDRAAVRDLAGEVEWAKVSMLTPEAYERAEGRVPPPGLTQQQVARIYQGYEAIKSERRMIDFEDVLLILVGILEDDEKIAATIRAQYKHFVVDEYQDVSPLQQRLLNLWLGGRDSICVVGDASQTIYSFTGATSAHLLGFAQAFKGAHVVRLVRDYRSTPQIVEAANTLLADRRPSPRDVVPWPEPLELRAQRPSGKPVAYAEFSDDTAEAHAVAEHIRTTMRSGISASEIAILMRTNGQAQVFEEVLAEHKIPYKVRGAERFYERPEVKQAMLQLRAASHAQEEDDNPATLTRAVLASLGWQEEAPQTSGATRQKWESLAALVSVGDEVIAARAARDESTTLADIVHELADRAENAHVPTLEGVTLASIHTAKGLEWDAVYLVGMSEGLMPISYAQTQAEIDEERRLFYVGITRARIQLHISWSLARSQGSHGTRKPSRFLTALSAAVRLSQPAERKAPPQRRTAPAIPKCKVCGTALTTAAERKIRHCSNCPISFSEPVFEALKSWRAQEAESTGKPAFVVFTDATLMAMAEELPSTELELLRISGVGKAKIDRYGETVLATIAEHRP